MRASEHGGGRISASLSSSLSTCYSGMRVFSSPVLRRLASPSASSSARAASGLPTIDPALLTADDAARFNADGVIAVRGVLSADWLAALRGAAEANLAAPGPLCDEHAAAAGTGGRFHDDQFLWRRHAACEEFVLHSGAGALAAKAMGSRTAHILYDQLFVKEPGTAAPTPWHNDTSYWHIRGAQVRQRFQIPKGRTFSTHICYSTQRHALLAHLRDALGLLALGRARRGAARARPLVRQGAKVSTKTRDLLVERSIRIQICCEQPSLPPHVTQLSATRIPLSRTTRARTARACGMP